MDLIRWIEILENWGGQALVRRPTDTILETDASDSGWGAFLRKTRREAKGVWSQSWTQRHINVKELQAVKLAVKTFKEELRGKQILLKIDNQVAMAYVNRMTGRIPELARIAREIIEELEQMGASIQAIYIPSEENIVADRLSRETDVHDWEVTRKTFRRLQEKAGTYTIDRFACRKTRKVKRYNSRLGEADSEAADGLSVPWHGENNWIVPPIPLVTKVVLKLKREKAKATVIVPDWKGQAWHRALREMATHEERLEEKEILKNNTTWVNKKWFFRAFLISGK
jgi:ribonuclease HI